MGNLASEHTGGSRMTKLISAVAGLPRGEAAVFRDSFIVGKNKQETCRDLAITGAEYDGYFTQIMRLLRGIKPAVATQTAD